MDMVYETLLLSYFLIKNLQDHQIYYNKFGDLADFLLRNKIVTKFHKPYPCSDETLKGAHSEKYIKEIKNKTLDENEVKKIGFPLVDSVVQRSLVATGGTVLASKLAINHGIACNTAGEAITQIMIVVQDIVFLTM